MRYEGYNGQVIADMKASTLAITREGIVAKVNFGFSDSHGLRERE